MRTPVVQQGDAKVSARPRSEEGFKGSRVLGFRVYTDSGAGSRVNMDWVYTDSGAESRVNMD